MNLPSTLGDQALHLPHNLLAGLRIGELGAQMGVGVEHDALGADLLGRFHDVRRGLRGHRLRLVLIILLDGDEGHQDLVHPTGLLLVGYGLGQRGGLLDLELHEIGVYVKGPHLIA